MNAEGSTRGKAAMRMLIPANDACVSRTIRECEEFMRQHGSGGTLRPCAVLRELIAKAVVRGKGNPVLRRLGVAVEHLGANHFRIEVEHQGDTLDFEPLGETLPENPRRTQSRGFLLVGALSDKVEFNDNGNKVTAYVTLNSDDE